MNISSWTVIGAVPVFIAVIALVWLGLGQATAQAVTESGSSQLSISGVTATTYEENGVAIIFTYGVSGGEDDDEYEWWLTGDDRSNFDLSGVSRDVAQADPVTFNSLDNPALFMFRAPPDFENPFDENGDNDYQATVNVRVVGGTKTASLAVTVVVTDVDESPDVARLPSAPLNVSVEVGGFETHQGVQLARLNVSWDPPLDQGSATITGYEVTRRNTANDWQETLIVRGLPIDGQLQVPTTENFFVERGTSHSVRVWAISGVGKGLGSAAGTVTVAPANSLATGAPTISGTAQVGQNLTASTSGISDADGLTNVSYSYQWLADDTEIDGATSSTYTVQSSDNGKVIKVRVDFRDDAGTRESLTSAGTSAVVLGGL